jgi:hypothetical protein
VDAIYGGGADGQGGALQEFLTRFAEADEAQHHQQHRRHRGDGADDEGEEGDEDEDDDEDQFAQAFDPFEKLSTNSVLRSAGGGAATAARERMGLFGYALKVDEMIGNASKFYRENGLPVSHELALAILQDDTWRRLPMDEDTMQRMAATADFVRRQNGVSCLNTEFDVEDLRKKYLEDNDASARRASSVCRVVLHIENFDREWAETFAALTPEEGDVLLATKIWGLDIATAVNVRKHELAGKAVPRNLVQPGGHTERIQSKGVESRIAQLVLTHFKAYPPKTEAFARAAKLLEARGNSIKKEMKGAIFIIVDPLGRYDNQDFSLNAFFHGAYKKRAPPMTLQPGLRLPIVSTCSKYSAFVEFLEKTQQGTGSELLPHKSATRNSVD